MKYTILSFFIIFSFLLMTAESFGGTKTWTGTVSGDWNTSGNWSPNGVPGNNDDVTINAGASITVSASVSCKSITFTGTGSVLSVNSSVTLAVSGAITIKSIASADNIISISGNGSISCNSLTVGTDITPTGGTHTTTLNSTINSLAVSGNLILYSDNISGNYDNSVLNQNSGTITVNGSFTTSNNNKNNTSTYVMGNISPTLILGGVTAFNISGTGASNITLSGSGATVIYNRSGNQTARPDTYTNLTLAGSGTKTFATTPTVNGVLSMEETATISVTGSGVVTYGTNATLQYNKPAAYTASSEEWITPFPSTGGVIIENTGTITMNAAKTLNTGVPLTISSNATLSVGGSNYALTSGGDFINNGTFTCGTGTVTFNGSANQNIGGTTATTFYNLTINKTGTSVILGTDATVNNTLTLTNGIFNITGHTLTIANGTTGAISIGTGSASNMILADDGTNQGTLKRKMTSNSANYLFPVGSTGKYTPMSMNFASGLGTSSYISANVYGIKHPNNTAGEPYINRYWEYNATGISSPSYSITLNWTASDVAGAEASLVFAKYSSGTWSLVTGTLNTSTHTFASNAGLTSFSSITGGHDGAMPVTLSSLTSSVSGRNINLKWMTSSETNNSGFDVERKVRSGEYIKVGFVKGKGTVSTPSSYEFMDRNLATGNYSYRLKQIDNNGNFEYFSLNGDVVVGVPSKFDLSQNYPNPFNPSTKINFDLPKDGLVSLKIYDMTGKEISTIVNEFRAAGYYTIDFNASSLSSGVYFYRISSGDFSSVKKMMLIK